MDKDDKSSAEKTVYNMDYLIEYESRTLSQRIGEITNISTGFANQTPNSDKSKKYIDDQNVFLRVAQGHEIDSIKTGTKYTIAPYYNKVKLPYFLIYRYPREKAFFNKIKKENKVKKDDGQNQDRYNVSLSHSPLNELCWDIEKWEREIMKDINMPTDPFTYKLLMNDSVEYNDINYWKVKQIYNEFNSDYKDTIKEFKGDEDIDKRIMSLYDDYKIKVKSLDIDKIELTNYCVMSSYIKDKIDLEKEQIRIERAKSKNKIARIHDKSTKFAWVVAPEQMLINLKSNSPSNEIVIIEFEDGQEYLGRKYKIVNKEDLLFAE